MIVFNALTKKARYGALICLLFAFAFNSIAAGIGGKERFMAEVASGDHLPQWFPKSSALIMKDALNESVFKSEEAGGEISREASYKKIVGVFSKFYISNSLAYGDICWKALSYKECKEMIWSKTEELLAKKIHLAASDAVNELLFLKNNPHLEEMRIPLEQTRASLGLEKGPGLANYLKGFVSEFNQGGYKTALFNDHDAYKEALPLLGKVKPSDMGSLLLGKGEVLPFKKKMARARRIFDLEWKLFANNALFPQTVLTAMGKAAEKAFYLTPSESLPKISSIALGMCEQAPARIFMSPEVGVLCRYLHQNS